jgi:anti-sigma-K factor RskA
VGRDSTPGGSDPRWHNPSIGRPVAVAVALLVVVAAVAAILYAVLHRIGGVVAGLVEPQSLVEALSTYVGPLC